MGFGQWTAPALLLTCAMAAQASAQDKRLKRSDLPPAVQKTADEQSAGAIVRGYSSETDGSPLAHQE